MGLMPLMGVLDYILPRWAPSARLSPHSLAVPGGSGSPPIQPIWQRLCEGDPAELFACGTLLPFLIHKIVHETIKLRTYFNMQMPY